MPTPFQKPRRHLNNSTSRLALHAGGIPPSAESPSGTYEEQEKRIYRGESDPAIYAEFGNQFIERHFPHLIHNGNKPYKVIHVNEIDSTNFAADILNYEINKGSPKSSFAAIAGKASRGLEHAAMAMVRGKERRTVAESIAAVNLGGANLRSNDTDFIHVVVGDPVAFAATEEQAAERDKTYLACALKNPLAVRQQQLADTFVNFHELSHTIATLDGTTRQRLRQYPKDGRFENYAEYLGEHQSDTFATLCAAKIFGKEGIEYAQQYDYNVKLGILSNLTNPFSYAHDSSESIENAVKFAQSHDVGEMSFSELQQLSLKLMRPKSPEGYVEMAQDYRTMTPDEVTAAREAIAPDYAAAIIETDKLNPISPPEFKGKPFDMDLNKPDHFVALVKFNQQFSEEYCGDFVADVEALRQSVNNLTQMYAENTEQFDEAFKPGNIVRKLQDPNL